MQSAPNSGPVPVHRAPKKKQHCQLMASAAHGLELRPASRGPPGTATSAICTTARCECVPEALGMPTGTTVCATVRAESVHWHHKTPPRSRRTSTTNPPTSANGKVILAIELHSCSRQTSRNFCNIRGTSSRERERPCSATVSPERCSEEDPLKNDANQTDITPRTSSTR